MIQNHPPINKNTKPGQDRTVVWPVMTSRFMSKVRSRRGMAWSLAGGAMVLLILLGIFYGPALYARFGPRTMTVSRPGPRTDARADQLQNRIGIPSLGIDAPIVYVDHISETAFQEALRSGVVHYPGTALPGQPGNTYLFGHSSDFTWSEGSYKTVFAQLPDIEIGAEVTVSDQRGNQFTYRVLETKVVQPDDLSVLEQDRTKARLTVQTSYPVGTAQRRFLVIAELVKP